MPVPLIGVTTSHSSKRRELSSITVKETYIQSVIRSGAAPVLIPLGLDENQLQEIVARLDGILFTGGGDIHPDRYGGDHHPAVDGVDVERDRTEIELVRLLTERRKPFLGICRGLQVINVALGGTIYEDIQDQHPHSIRHDYHGDFPRSYLGHEVEVQPASKLAGILGSEKTWVNSLHHQGIRDLAVQAEATAYAPDGIVEAIELHDYPFGLAVQWHPECLQEHVPMRELFKSFVRAASTK